MIERRVCNCSALLLARRESEAAAR